MLGHVEMWVTIGMVAVIAIPILIAAFAVQKSSERKTTRCGFIEE